MKTITTPSASRFPDAAVAALLLLYTYAALSKLLEFDKFRGQLYNQNIPRSLAGPLAWILPFAELLVCALLWYRPARWYGLVLSLGLLSVFTVYIGMVLLDVWDKVPCSCGGVLSSLSWGPHLVFNLFFLILNAWTLLYQDRSPIRRRPLSGSAHP